ncbi:hypothetical protein Trisim1_009255 [Trichoderma cf. simile WF8]|uniref:Urea carboxylase n=1 Tax=Trichoderma guizhouense TaxID=1491466 RepID=A0A1T3CJB1_9HYPO|nr:urea carboxylase [Trichoderma guizhouense]
MTRISRSREGQPPLLIHEWRAVQASGGGLQRLCSLVQRERSSNAATRAWISICTDEQLKEQWDHLHASHKQPTSLPLYGVPFAAKDNIDAAGFTTTAACPAFGTTPATEDASVVARLKAAGAILIGKTNLDQFATGLVGTRSPFGAVPNSFDPTRVSGGSSSGSAVVVARGAVPFSLGTDTAGSGRVPAGLNNIVGLKPTRGALSARGVVPACRTLDCVSIFALTADDAETVLSVAEGFDAQDSYSRVRPLNTTHTSDSGFGSKANQRPQPVLAICANPPWFGRDDQSPSYEAALDRARSLGWVLQPVDFTLLFELASLLYFGPWVAERYQAIRTFIQNIEPDQMDPVVRKIIKQAESFSATDAFEGEYKRQDLTRQIELAFAGYDGLLVPTSLTFPTLEQVALSPVEENSRLGTYTNFVNFLDWSALSVPAGFRRDGLPFGITLIANNWQEPHLLRWARAWLAGQTRTLGAVSALCLEPALSKSQEAHASEKMSEKSISVAVVGAHLSGMPLNKDLVSRGAVLSRKTRTSNRYRLFALQSKSGPPRPGLQRLQDAQAGAEIVVEIWELPETAYASFADTIPSPLSIGKIELRDHSWVSGFVCEPYGLEGAVDITHFAGWRSYISHLNQPEPASLGSVSTALIANRGEIAVRIIKTLHRLGLKAVAIYSSVDANSPHVHLADLAYELKGQSVAETYLSISQILAIAKSAGVNAIIPGYGFLAENADFATAVEDAGITWVGPTPAQMVDLGLKHRARALAIESGVPVVPGSKGTLTSLDDALAEAQNVGYPLMLKSTAGGGGIGLRRCANEAELRDAFEGVQRQAVANFGDGAVFIERFVELARHIEIQVIGDGRGAVVTAGERDCTLQRRHQKIVEESPAIMVPEGQRAAMRAAAVRLAAHLRYRNVGTIEFIYDVNKDEFYFLEVNTRLQVEHPVTELVTGLDLAECMLQVAAGQEVELFSSPVKHLPTTGASIEVRLYAESPLEQFRPCAGTVSKLNWPESLRVDTWIDEGTHVTTLYDSMIAKLIAVGSNRREALERLADGLNNTVVEGVQTNLDYLRQIVASELFSSGSFHTKSLDSFQFISSTFEVIACDGSVSVQDYPGRTGYWSVGIPPSGPADSLSFRLANRLVSNDDDAAGLECTLHGPRLRFHRDAVIAVTGGETLLLIDEKPAPLSTTLRIQAGQTVHVGAITAGYHVYIAIGGGIQVPSVMGSRSTFELAKMGGYKGRSLRPRDIVPIGTSQTKTIRLLSCPVISMPKQVDGRSWRIRVLPGPHGAPDYFTRDGLVKLFSSTWKVHHNSNRLGIRLSGPKPEWARDSGGEAGLHPSNIHDSPYSIGSVSFTGDEAVILGCDGPSLGGFVAFSVIISADQWKMGQLRPGDSVSFEPISSQAALKLDSEFQRAISQIRLPYDLGIEETIDTPNLDGLEVVLGKTTHNGHDYVCRQAGDNALLIEIDGASDFDLARSFEIFAFCERHREQPVPGVQELTPGVGTIHVIYDHGLPAATLIDRLFAHLATCQLRRSIPSRTVRLPLAFDDTVCRAAVERYASTIRGEAPWLPSNIEFLQELNGIEDISMLLHSAIFLVVGLGDVFLGSPCAVPLDPRHRLFGTKYNPSRSFTPRGAVGIGGQYLCIYATDSPGGYQLVGRTKEIWASPEALPSTGNQPPWLFRQFDRITFYPVTEEELDSQPADKLIQIVDGELDLTWYECLLADNKELIAQHRAQQRASMLNVPFLEDLSKPYIPKSRTVNGSSKEGNGSAYGTQVPSAIPGRCFEVHVQPGQKITKGHPLVSIESCKMEVVVRSPLDGVCSAVMVEAGDNVDAGDVLAVID